jgi:hypothetical protein
LLRTWRLDPSGKAEPALMHERSYQDNYADPGSPLNRPGPYGWGVIHQVDGGILLSGRGIRPEGVHPFLDLMDLETGKTSTLWKAGDTHHETLTAVIDAEATSFITRRQSKTEPPNYQRRVAGKRRATALTAFEDWAPQFATVQKEVVTYTRDDGVELQAEVYTPPGWKPSDGPLPTVFWAYPNEFKSKADAGQKTMSDNMFTRPSPHSPLWFCLQGYAVVNDPTLPIVGEGETEPNDNFVLRRAGTVGSLSNLRRCVLNAANPRPGRTVAAQGACGAKVLGWPVLLPRAGAVGARVASTRMNEFGQDASEFEGDEDAGKPG